MRPLTFAAVSVAMMTIGCASRVTVSPVGSSAESRVGVPHPLMFNQFEIRVARTVTECGEKPRLAVKVTIGEPKAAPDPLHRYVIDPSLLSTMLKSGNLTVEYAANGAPKSLNAKVTDETATVISSAGAVLSKIAAFKAVPTGTPSDSATDAKQLFEVHRAPIATTGKLEACTEQTLTSFKAHESSSTKLEGATSVLQKETAKLKAVNEKIAALAPNIDEGTKAALSKAWSAVNAAAARVKELQKELDSHKANISLEEKFVWPDNGDEASFASLLRAGTVARWFDSGKFSPSAAWLDSYSVRVDLTPVAKDARQLDDKSRRLVADTVVKDLGIPYRQPAVARLASCLGSQPCTDGATQVESTFVEVLQMGWVYYLPCVSRPFQSVECSYTLADSGRVQKMGASGSAGGVGLSGAVKDLASSALEAKQAREGAALKQLEADAAYYKALADLEEAKKKAAGTPNQALKDSIDALELQTKELNAQRALIEAEAALKDAQAKREPK